MTDQEKREKVINGLECCLAATKCGICPYNTGNDLWCGNNDQLLEDALALLKAQEPRVMTLDEVVALQEGKGDVWIEETKMPGITPGIIAATLTEKTEWQEHDALWFSDDECHYVTDYNLNTADGWRCWTSRPTDEQREATPWN